jgi:hypothetical protein
MSVGEEEISVLWFEGALLGEDDTRLRVLQRLGRSAGYEFGNSTH